MMVISRTPFRISFFGGGTDYPAWYRDNGGLVLGATIDKYCYVIVRYLPPFFSYKYRIRYTQREETQTIDEIKHPSVRECLRFVNFDRGVEIQHNADLPAQSGIGSSSAFTVGLLNALYALKGKMVTKRQLALEAIYVEQERIGESVGSQDQTFAAFGGFNRITFGGAQEVVVQPVIIDPEKLALLQKHCVLFFTGFSRNASEIAAEQISKIPERNKELQTMRQLTDEAVNVLCYNGASPEEFGRLLHENWQVKRSLTSKITTFAIDEIYQAGRSAGAMGGKLLGAGGGGFILFFIKPELQPAIREKLQKLVYVPFKFEDLGTQIIYYRPNDNF
jgi:D-glycero-alpha-D-manno-heptose-7-phosphate kinase